MAEITVGAETGRKIGSRPTGRLRAAGRIPAVVYGHGTEAIPISVEARDLRHALNTPAGVNALLLLDVDGTQHLTLARALQRHPVRNTVIHVDFQIVRRDEVVSAEVAIALVGEAKKVQQEGGVIDQQLFNITVHATPGNIPSSIEVDITPLAVGDAVRVGDLELPEGVTTEVDPEDTVVVAQASQVSELDLIPEADIEGLKELAEAQAAEAEAAGESAGEG